MAKKSLRALDKAIKKSGLTREKALEAIATEWELNHLIKPEDMTTVPLHFSTETKEDKQRLKIIKKAAKELKISVDAIVVSALMLHLQEEGFYNGK